MPIAGTFDVNTSHIDTLNNTQLSHAIAHPSSLYLQYTALQCWSKADVNELYYLVTLIGSNGLPDPMCTEKVFDGHLMNKWIAKVGSGIVKSKFIYDETINTRTSTLNQGIDHQGVGSNFTLSQTTPNFSVDNAYGLAGPLRLSHQMVHSNLLSQSMQYGRHSMPFSQGAFADHSTDINNRDDWFNTGGV